MLLISPLSPYFPPLPPPPPPFSITLRKKLLFASLVLVFFYPIIWRWILNACVGNFKMMTNLIVNGSVKGSLFSVAKKSRFSSYPLPLLWQDIKCSVGHKPYCSFHTIIQAWAFFSVIVSFTERDVITLWRQYGLSFMRPITVFQKLSNTGVEGWCLLGKSMGATISEYILWIFLGASFTLHVW